jgi:hypothetical protein
VEGSTLVPGNISPEDYAAAIANIESYYGVVINLSLANWVRVDLDFVDVLVNLDTHSVEETWTWSAWYELRRTPTGGTVTSGGTEPREKVR